MYFFDMVVLLDDIKVLAPYSLTVASKEKRYITREDSNHVLYIRSHSTMLALFKILG